MKEQPEHKHVQKHSVQENLCQKLLFLHQLTQNMTTDFLSYCGLVDARISASEKDLPVQTN